MRSLFWKIFLSFWLLLTSLVLLLVLTISSHRHQSATRFVFRDVSLVIANANYVVAEYDHGGINAFSAALAKAQARIAGDLWILDENGNPIQGGELPEPFKQAAQMHTEVDHIPGAMLVHIPFEHEEKHYLALVRFILPPAAQNQPFPDNPPPPPPAARFEQPPGSQHFHEGPHAGGFAHVPPPPGGIPFLNDLTLQIPVGILLSSTICFLLARYLTRPITSLRMAAQSIASGDLKARADRRFEGKDELGELSRDFNQMAIRLEETLNGQQRMFADVSHELRSPLTRLNLALELAKQRSGPEAASALQRIELETTRMNDLVTQILRLAKLEAVVLTKQSEEIGVADLLHDVTEDAEIEASAKQCTLLATNECNAVLQGNYEALRSAIENVVRNAIKYSPNGANIQISQRQAGSSQVAIEILDRGPGIAEEELEKVFQPFHRADDSRTRSTGGVGLGLAIAQRAIAAHGGSISAANQKDAGLLVKIFLNAVSFR